MPAWILLIIQLLPSLIKIIRGILGNLPKEEKVNFKRDLKDALKGPRKDVAERVKKVVEKYS